MRILFSIASLMLIATVAAADPSARATADQTTVTVGRPFRVRLEGSGSDVKPPQWPAIEGLAVISVTTQSSTQMQIMNGRTSMSVTQGYTYIVRAMRTGQITIPAIPMQIDGQTINTEPIQLTVLDAGAPPPPNANPNANPQAGVPGAPGAQGAPPQRAGQPRRQASKNDACRVHASVDKKEVYQGEPIMLTLSLMRLQADGLRLQPRGRDFEPPSSEGFYAVMLEPGTIQKTEDGLPFEVTEYHEMLYPTQPGDLKIGAWHFEGIASYGFFEQWPVSVEAPPIDIKVLPLPERPANFSGAVGDFTIKALPARTDTVQGVPVKLQIAITGRGNPDAIGDLQMPKLENVYISDPEKETKPVKVAGGYGMQKTFTYNITPLQPGDLKFPEIQFCYFDPASKEYKTGKTDAIILHVQSSGETKPHMVVSSEVQQTQGKVEVLGEDILPLITDPGRLRPTHSTGIGWPAMAVTPPAAFCGLVLFMRRKRRFESDTGYARDYFAKTKSHKRLKNVLASSEPTEELYKSLTGFIADKLNVKAEGMTSGDARQLLESRQVDAELIENLMKILRACERARYASVKISPDEAAALTQAAGIAIDALDRTLRSSNGSRKDKRA